MTEISHGTGLVTTSRLLAGTLFGGQLVWAATIVPTLRRLPAADFVKMHSLLTWYADALMPALGGATTVSGLLRHRRAGGTAPLVGSAALGVASVAAVRNLRINARLRTVWADSAPPPADLVRRERDRWALQHLCRTAGGVVAFVAFLGDDRVDAATWREGNRARRAAVTVASGLVAVAVGRDVVRHLTMTAGRGPEGDVRALVAACRFQ